MTKQFKVFLSLLLGLPLLVAMLVGLNFIVISQLLHIDSDVLSRVESEFVPVAKPLVLKVDEDENLSEAAQEVLAALHVRGNHLPRRHPLLIDISWVQRANPYPPLLAEVSSGYKMQLGYCSFGYLGVDGRYHQVTLYVGEADSLPSFLVKKVRQSYTLGGDYFVQYLFLMSRDAQLVDENGRATTPQIDAIEWSSYRGGSYDGFEEIIGNALAIVLELFLISLVLAIRFMKPSGRKGPASIQPIPIEQPIAQKNRAFWFTLLLGVLLAGGGGCLYVATQPSPFGFQEVLWAALLAHLGGTLVAVALFYKSREKGLSIAIIAFGLLLLSFLPWVGVAGLLFQ